MSTNIEDRIETQFAIKTEKNPKDMSIKLNGLHIKQVTHTKFLGLYIDNEITWNYHINRVSSKIEKMTGIIGKARYFLPRKCLLTLYNTVVYPYLSYCNITWTST